MSLETNLASEERSYRSVTGQISAASCGSPSSAFLLNLSDNNKSLSYTIIPPDGLTKSEAPISLNKYAQKPIFEKSVIPDINDNKRYTTRFLGTHFVIYHLKRKYIKRMLNPAVREPKMVFTSFTRSVAISAGLIPKLIKNLACSGLNTI
jgi:hypothetical protein